MSMIGASRMSTRVPSNVSGVSELPPVWSDDRIVMYEQSGDRATFVARRGASSVFATGAGGTPTAGLGRRAPRRGDDSDGARSRARLLRRHRHQPHESGDDDHPAVLHAMGHALLRPDVLSLDRDRCVPGATPPRKGGAVALSRNAWPLDDRARRRDPPLPRLAVQLRLSRHDPHRAVGARLGDDHAVIARALVTGGG